MTQAAVRTPPTSSRDAGARPAPVAIDAPAPSGTTALGGRRRTAELAAVTASVLGLASAALGLGWALGGTLLIDTVLLDAVVARVAGSAGPGAAETSTAVAVAVAVVWLTVLAAMLPGWALSPDAPAAYPSGRRRVARALAWVEAVVLTAAGATLVVRAVLALPDTAGADERALMWQAVLWGPWLLAWGGAALVAVVASHAGPRPDAAPPTQGPARRLATDPGERATERT